jgi:DNA-directed RNA polymerase subunit RPC12/RpoP
MDVDWEAYNEARENDERPPCPRCGFEDVDTIPVTPPLVCGDCGHNYGYAGGYY